MSKYNFPDFFPDLTVIAQGSDRLVIVFDTACAFDLKRTSRIVMIDTVAIRSIEPLIDELVFENHTTALHASGKIVLRTEQRSPETSATQEPTTEPHGAETYLLAQFELLFPSQGRPDKDGKYVLPSELEVTQLIRQGVCDAFTEASLEVLVNQPNATAEGSSGSVRDPSQTSDHGLRALSPLTWAGVSQRSQAMPFQRWSTKKIAFFTIAGLIALFFLVRTVVALTTPRDPYQAAVNRAIAANPESINQQVEQTRQILAQMGLNPGKGGDLGCLTGK